MTDSKIYLSEEEQLFKLAEQLQTENETLRLELQTKSSDNQKLSYRVQELTGKLVTMNESDKLLQSLKEREKRCSEREKEAKRTISSYRQSQCDYENNIKNHYQQSISDNETATREAKQAKKQAEADQKRYTELSKKSAIAVYRQFTYWRNASFVVVALYGLVITILTGTHTEALRSDLASFFITIGGGFKKAAEGILWIATGASKLGDMIPQNIAAFIVHWLLFLVIWLIAIVAALFLVCKAGAFLIELYAEHYADNISLIVFLFSLAPLVAFAEPIRSVISINLLLLWLILHVVYMIARCIFEKKVGTW